MGLRPLYRWKSFGLGVLFLAFLGWGWVRSMSWIDGVFWLTRHSIIVTAGHATGAMFFTWDHSRPPSTVRMIQWIHEPTSRSPDPWFPKAMNLETYDRQLQISIAHWFLMVVFLLPWSGWLAWRRRRMRRLAKTS